MHRTRKGLSWKEILLALKREWECDNVGDVAGALSFSGVLAMFPFLLFVVSLASLVLDPADATALVDDLYRVAPAAVADILGERLRALAAGDRPGLATVSAAGAVWAASGGVAALIRAFNTAYDVEETRPFWKVRGLAVLTTLGGAVLAVAAAAIAIVAPVVARPLGGTIEALVAWLRMPLAALLMMVLLALLYYVLPNIKLPFRWITPGSVLAVAIWIVASLGFSFVVSSFGRYEVTYGALAGIIVLLLWMWISAQAVLLGAELNGLLARTARRSGSTPPRASDPSRC